jgi:hypothetical protein
VLFPLLLALLADPAALNGKVLAETRAGESPVGAGQASEAYASSLLIPQVELRIRDRRTELRLAYLPQLVWQLPAVTDLNGRPLLLHQAGFTLVTRPSETTNLLARGSGAFGQPDYYSLPQLIGPGQAAVPQVTTILTATGTVTFSQDLTRRTRLTLGATASHYQPYGSAAANLPPGTTLARSTAVAVVPGVLFRLTPLDDLSGNVLVSDAQYSTGVDVFMVTPRVSWLRRRPAGDDFRLTLGLSYARDRGSKPALLGASPFLPTGSVAATWHPIRYEGYSLAVGFTSTVEQYVDPVLAVSGPRAQLGAQVLLVMVPDWMVGVRGDSYFSLRTTPLPGDPDETTFTLSSPVRHRISKNVTMELGARWIERGPALSSPAFAFRERQLLAYLSLTANTEDAPPYTSH